MFNHPHTTKYYLFFDLRLLGHKIFHCVIGEEFLKLTVQLCCQCFIVRYDQCRSKLATTSSTGGLLLALQRAIVTARPKGRYRKHFCWPAIKRYYSNLLVSILLLALLYTFELLHLLYCQSFQHNIL